ncbi:MAG TPA: hypothetical protein VJA83_06115 [Sulfuricurvum sp.]|nr:hypothetical protein [Sulfuricurvum sp.]
MKKSAAAALGIFVVWVLLSIVQLWGSVFEVTTYWKLSVTLALVLIAVVVSGLIYREYIEEAHMKQDGYIE